MRDLITIDKRNFLAGASTGDYAADGGFSPSSRFNPFVEKGVVAFPSSPTSLSGSVNGTTIAAARKMAYARDTWFITDTGYIYSAYSTSITQEASDPTSNRYIRGITDMVWYTETQLYISHNDDVGQLDDSTSPPSYNPTWWSGLAVGSLYTGAPHPLAVVEDTLYIGDRNRIHAWNGAVAGGGATYKAVEFPPHIVITDLVKHPDGRHLIVFATTGNYERTLYEYEPGIAYLVDTTSWEFVQEVRLSMAVSAARQVGDTIFCIASDRLTYFTGNNLQDIRTLTVGPKTTSYPVSKHQMVDWKGHLFLVENDETLASLANLGQGWGYFPILSTGAQCIAVHSDDALHLGSTTISRFEIEDRGTSGTFVSNWYDLPRRAMVQGVEVEYSPATTGTGQVSVAVDNANGISASATIDLSGLGRRARAGMYLETDRLRVQVVSVAGDPLIHAIRVFGEYV